MHFPRASLWLLVSTLASAVGAHAQTVTYANFTDTTGLRVNSASVTSGAIVLADTGRDRGSVFTQAAYSFSEFSAKFEFIIANPSGSTDSTGINGADGLTFILQNDPRAAAALGSFKEGLGYGGITNSLAIEFDTFKNDARSDTANDPDSNHIGIDTGGSVNSVATVSLGTRLDNGSKWTVWVDFNGVMIELRMSQDGVRPASTTMSYPISSAALASLIGSNSAYVGFAAATGSATADHQLLNFSYSPTYLTNGIPAVPEPSVYWLIAGGAVALIAGRRKLARA